MVDRGVSWLALQRIPQCRKEGEGYFVWKMREGKGAEIEELGGRTDSAELDPGD